MQRRNFGKRMRYLVAVGTLVSAFALFACGGDDEPKNVAVTIPLTSVSLPAVQGVPLAIPSGQVFGGPANSSATLTFVDQNTFTFLSPGGITASGFVSFGQPSVGSCTFVTPITAGFIQVATTFAATVCNINIVAQDVESDPKPGILNLVFSGLPGTATTNNVAANVFINDDDILVVVNPVLGFEVPTGVEP